MSIHVLPGGVVYGHYRVEGAALGGRGGHTEGLLDWTNRLARLAIDALGVSMVSTKVTAPYREAHEGQESVVELVQEGEQGSSGPGHGSPTHGVRHCSPTPGAIHCSPTPGARHGSPTCPQAPDFSGRSSDGFFGF